MRVIITGGTGLIGRALARGLAADGHQAIILSRSSGRHSPDRPGIEFVDWDGRTGRGWAHLADDADAIVNLAGANLAAGRWTERRKREIVESRVNAGQAVVDAVRSASRRPAVVIQASGSNYYGPSRGEIQTEESPAGSDFLARVCVEWEASSAPVEELGVRRAVIRSTPVLARDSVILKRLALPFRFFVGGPIGSGNQWFPWIHIDDEIRAIRQLIDDSTAAGPFNLVAPGLVTNREFARALGRALKRPALVPVPAVAVRLALGEMATTVLDGTRVVPARLLERGFAFRFADVDAALHDLMSGERSPFRRA